MGVVCNPPQPGEESYESFVKVCATDKVRLFLFICFVSSVSFFSVYLVLFFCLVSSLVVVVFVVSFSLGRSRLV